MKTHIERVAFVVQGQVQGVGFRPFVWRLAKTEKLTGIVRNTSVGVRIEAQGAPQAIEAFASRLEAELPTLAKITDLKRFPLPIKDNEEIFAIAESERTGEAEVLVSPDVSICDDCLQDIRDPTNRRFQYPFANCTNCGPRFSITRKLPYDRPFTTMACFPMCTECSVEYTDPTNRRFHAQPIACTECGPKIWFVEKEQAHNGNTWPTAENCANALARAGQALLAGNIVAIRGLGGFQLACDAKNITAVTKLRARKRRPHKALAVMFRNIEAARKFCHIGKMQENLLTGNRKPIVLCKRKPDAKENRLTSVLSPDTLNLGLMLPYTPLHALLFDWLAEHGNSGEPALVMTSANLQGEPICLGNREAIQSLAQLADAWLLHNRDILCRVDDSVVAVYDETPVFLRRARGYVPEPVDLGFTSPPILAAGALLKNTFCLTRKNKAFLSQHIGDLDSPACLDFYEEALAHLQSLLAVRPVVAAHDLNPDFASSVFARNLAAQNGIPAIPVQHHLAHAAACLGENNCFQPALALCLDGNGLGTDGEIWGAELLFVNLEKAEWHRLGTLDHFPLPGGEAAIREPWRIAAALAWLAGESIASRDKKHANIEEMLSRGVNTPWTTSCGRLFDAMASFLGLCNAITYEGQAAMLLEKAALQWQPEKERKFPEFAPAEIIDSESQLRLNSVKIFMQAKALLEAGYSIPAIAYVFHKTLAYGFAQMAAIQAQRHGIGDVALSGGAMQNSLLFELLPKYLRKAGLRPILHRQTPPNDGCLAFGQALWAGRLLFNKHI